MSEHKHLIADFDSIIWPTLTVWAEHSGDELHGYEHCTDWDYPIRLAGGLEPFIELLRQTQTYETMQRFGPFPGAVETLNELMQRRVKVTLLTDQVSGQVDAVVATLSDHGFTPDVAVACKAEAKVAYALEHGCDLLLEDRPSTIEAAHAAGIPVAGLRFRYNQATFSQLRLPSAANWQELRPLIHQLLDLPSR